ncbi:dTDP-4-dehydrorhamnose reductase [Staphylospora marina]|uniref:dTDP-4-dehydrorhamnose reductase n=1 Tax=Staphylospora marina TaxID=2490858 RepID=UPI000F5BBD67|nr:dTDP-4-dehydrorhamnose reductase [Staphylospora marina]
MNVLVTGAGGQLGMDVVRLLRERGRNVTGYTRKTWDVSEHRQTVAVLDSMNPDVVIHCAAWTRVDEAELDPSGAFRDNVLASRLLAEECSRRGIRLVHISTDYVFDGAKTDGYVEEDETRPLNVYGKTKRLAEKWVLRLAPDAMILRTSWLYGVHGKNFVYAILEKLERGLPFSVVNDQEGCPTHTLELASLIDRLLDRWISGIVHAGAGGRCTWYEFAGEIARLSGQKCPMHPVSSEEMARPARRPACSVLLPRRLEREGVAPIGHWKEGLEGFFRCLREGERTDD